MDTKLKKSSNRGVFYSACLITILSGTITMIAASSLTNILQKAWWLMIYDEKIPKEIRTIETTLWIVAIVAVLLCIISFIVAGALYRPKFESDGLKLNIVDKIYSEIQILVFIFMLVPISLIAQGMFYVSSVKWLFIKDFKSLITETVVNGLEAGISSRDPEYITYSLGYAAIENDNDFAWMGLTGPLLIAILSIAAIFCFIISIAIFMSIIKKIKAGKFISTSFIGRIFISLSESFSVSVKMTIKIVGVLLLGSFLSVSGIPMPIFGGSIGYLVPIAILVFVPKMLKKYIDISNGVKRINEGDMDYQIDVEGHGELARLAKGINGISSARTIAVRDEIKNQKMKATLISNVSHDLKTPLTSMITYLDLMKVEGLDSPRAAEYLDIIDGKTRRLQRLTEDLFEAAKASSGDMKVNLMPIDLCSMMHQSIGEMNSYLEYANLQVILNFDKEVSFVRADGNLLGRIIENFLINASKYALAGSRVYVDITSGNPDLGESTTLSIKNVSRDKLNIDPTELMERFTRGESARNTEGSGLGLTIAKDLAELMGGNIEIAIDGDLFRASLNLIAEKMEEEKAGK